MRLGRQYREMLIGRQRTASAPTILKQANPWDPQTGNRPADWTAAMVFFRRLSELALATSLPGGSFGSGRQMGPKFRSVTLPPPS
jgi:hypothetical protein